MTVTYEQTMHIFQTYDKNGDGTVDFIEFKVGMRLLIS